MLLRRTVKLREDTYEVVVQLLAKDVWDVDESLILGVVAGRCGDVGLYASDRFVCTWKKRRKAVILTVSVE